MCSSRVEYSRSLEVGVVHGGSTKGIRPHERRDGSGAGLTIGVVELAPLVLCQYLEIVQALHSADR